MRQLILAGPVAFFATVHFSVVANNTTTHSNVHFLHNAFGGRIGCVRALQFRNDTERLCSYVPDSTGESGSGDGRSVQLSSAGYNNIKQECPL